MKTILYNIRIYNIEKKSFSKYSTYIDYLFCLHSLILKQYLSESFDYAKHHIIFNIFNSFNFFENVIILLSLQHYIVTTLLKIANCIGIIYHSVKINSFEDVLQFFYN